jgi:predicted NUDIX family phosphoesterase
MESIWVIPRTAMFGGRWPQGFIPAAALSLATLEQVVAEQGFATLRERAEATPEWKQPIPYCAVLADAEVLCVERLPKQGEGRLHGKLSLGFGGHVDASDIDGSGDLVQRALDRELAEELGLPPERARRRFLGVINDDSSPVGVVHFGLAFAQWVADPKSVQVRESSKMRGAFRRLVDSDELWQDLQRFESWSRILLEVRALEVLAHPTPRRDSES